MRYGVWGAVLLVVLAGCSASAEPVASVPVASAPVGWRSETFEDVQLAVPKYWDYGTTGQPYCVRRGPGHAGRPYVGRPGGIASGECAGPTPDSPYRVHPGGTFVWFEPAANHAWGTTPQTGRIGDRETLVVDGVRVVVQAPDQLRRRILATVRQATTDAHGCPTTPSYPAQAGWRPAAGVPVTELTGVDTVTACQYAVNSGSGRLVSSIRLTDRTAASAVAGVAASPIGSGPKAFRSCRPSPAYSLFDLIVRSDQGTSRLVMKYETCDQRGFDDGHAIRGLTRRSVAPFVATPNTVDAIPGDLASVF